MNNIDMEQMTPLFDGEKITTMYDEEDYISFDNEVGARIFNECKRLTDTAPEGHFRKEATVENAEYKIEVFPVHEVTTDSGDIRAVVSQYDTDESCIPVVSLLISRKQKQSVLLITDINPAGAHESRSKAIEALNGVFVH